MSNPAGRDDEDPPPEQLAALEARVLADPHLSRLALDWMLGNSRSLADFLTYNRALIEAHRDAGDTARAPRDGLN